MGFVARIHAAAVVQAKYTAMEGLIDTGWYQLTVVWMLHVPGQSARLDRTLENK